MLARIGRQPDPWRIISPESRWAKRIIYYDLMLASCLLTCFIPWPPRVLFGRGQTLRNSPQLAKTRALDRAAALLFPRTALRCASSSPLCCYCMQSLRLGRGRTRPGGHSSTVAFIRQFFHTHHQSKGSRLPCANLPTPRFIHTWTTTRSRNLWRGLLGTRGRCGMALGVAARTNIANALRHVRLPLRH